MEINNLTVKYAQKIIFNDFNLTLEQGKVNCILGASGCGKTTLLKAISGLVQYQGKISGQGRISFCFQSPTLIPNINCFNNCMIVAGNKSNQEYIDKVLDLFNIFDIAECLYKFPTQISGGQASRVALARAVAYGGDTFLFDEAFKGLDYKIKYNILSKLRRLIAKDSTIILVTHDIDEALIIGDNIVVLERKASGVQVVVSQKTEHLGIERSLDSPELTEEKNILLQKILK